MRRGVKSGFREWRLTLLLLRVNSSVSEFLRIFAYAASVSATVLSYSVQIIATHTSGVRYSSTVMVSL